MSDLDKKIMEAWTPDVVPAHTMSLRIWLAGQAISSVAWYGIAKAGKINLEPTIEDISSAALALADAIIAKDKADQEEDEQ